MGDSLPEIVLVNAHDGTSAYKLMAGIFRLVCSNGMIVAESMQDSISIQHKGDIVGQVIEGSMKLADQSHVALEKAKEWKTLQLTNGEQSVFANAAHSMRFADADGKVTTPITPDQLLRARRNGDTGNDLWTTLNRVQENVIRGGLHAYTRDSQNHLRRVSSRPVNGIDQDVRLNRALWILAKEMEKLKRGN